MLDGVFYPKSSLPDQNAITLMFHHFDAEHPGTNVHFKMVDDSEAIRNLLGRNEKWLWKCRLGDCNPIIPGPEDEYARSEKKSHLTDEHLDELYRAADPVTGPWTL
jgi:hypothetical protein